ncbi:hypothetical protein HK099_005882 [Clydaea vesicula]|uniref:Alpha-ketoglutarate-dependent dioxygenase AlkB-like domain-containing protein n=1 Tax=Clydaea vesicula TaxID=447962 RepID=A0AAD5U6F8_9FUNG|nr:hypothetical protein HK099_005882 [Clydaea vesicula]KAJ3392313.1 hypothetical protein HDU92_008544 [Lobulomyces angularis]
MLRDDPKVAINNIKIENDFITEVEAEYLLSKVYAAPKPKWVQLKNRRLQLYGCQYLKRNDNKAEINQQKETQLPMIKEEFPIWLEKISQRISNFLRGIGVDMVPNQCLINEYFPNQGIFRHNDGPAFKPMICTLSLGEYTILNFFDTNKFEDLELTSDFPSTKVYLPKNSLVFISEDAYLKNLHSIDDFGEDFINKNDKIINFDFSNENETHYLKKTNTRVSLTFRIAKNVVKNNFFKF